MAKEEVTRGMRDVDQAADPDSCVRYLDAVRAQGRTQAFKQRSFELLHPQVGAHLLDVGCGTGEDVQTLARMVGGTGRAVGIDSSETMIAEARKRAEGLNLPVEYSVGEAQQLGFPANTFDGCRAERLFQHVANPAHVLAEMVLVTRPGGWLVVLDPDFETVVLDGVERGVTRKVLHFLCDTMIRNGWIVRQLPALFQAADLREVNVSADTVILTEYTFAMQGLRLQEAVEQAQMVGIVSAAEAEAWLSQLAQARQGGRFFAALTGFFVSGQKP